MSIKIANLLTELAVFCLFLAFLGIPKWQKKQKGLSSTAAAAGQGGRHIQNPVSVLAQRTELRTPAQNDSGLEGTKLAVRHLGNQATVLIRSRRQKDVYTGSVIVWFGKKRRKGMTDSHYDLGVITSSEPLFVVAEQFLQLAKQKIEELSIKGRRRKKAKAADQEAGQGVCASELVQIQEAIPTDVPMQANGTVKLRRFPLVYRGTITEAGVMKRCRDGNEFSTFGIRYITSEGIAEELFGTHLQTALREARTWVGDHVEIIRVGQKSFNNGKVPMGLFQVTKLEKPEE